MKIIDLIQNTAEWLEFRKGKIGASDAPKIYGSYFSTPLELWERKIGLAPEQEETYPMRRGKALEDEARKSFEEAIGFEFPPCVVQHSEYEWMIASLDGLSRSDGQSLWIPYALEIKVPGREDHLSALAGIVPPKYIPQLQHQLAVTGLPMIYYYSYDGKDNACIEVQRDQAYIDKLIAEELKFYKCMITCTPPELSERDYNIRYDDKWKLACKEWEEASQNLRLYKFREEITRSDLIALCESRNSKGAGVKVQKIMRVGSVDYSAIPALEGIDLDQYRKPASESWRITLDE